MLPEISPSRSKDDLKSILLAVKDKLGSAGKSAMQKYLDTYSINRESVGSQLLSDVFDTRARKSSNSGAAAKKAKTGTGS